MTLRHSATTMDKIPRFFFCLVQLSVGFDLPLIKITTFRSLYTEFAGNYKINKRGSEKYLWYVFFV